MDLFEADVLQLEVILLGEEDYSVAMVILHPVESSCKRTDATVDVQPSLCEVERISPYFTSLAVLDPPVEAVREQVEIGVLDAKHPAETLFNKILVPSIGLQPYMISFSLSDTIFFELGIQVVVPQPELPGFNTYWTIFPLMPFFLYDLVLHLSPPIEEGSHPVDSSAESQSPELNEGLLVTVSFTLPSREEVSEQVLLVRIGTRLDHL